MKTEGHHCAFIYCTQLLNNVHSDGFPIFKYKAKRNFKRRGQQGWSGIQSDFWKRHTHGEMDQTIVHSMKIPRNKFKTKGWDFFPTYNIITCGIHNHGML